MTHPFKKGDVVYHPDFGKGEVVGVTDVISCGVRVCFIAATIWCRPNLLSFKEWAKPDHERPVPPIKVGWWVVAFANSTDYSCRWIEGGEVFYCKGHKTAFALSAYTCIKYIGETLEEQLSSTCKGQ